jgi:hypothetical protein
MIQKADCLFLLIKPRPVKKALKGRHSKAQGAALGKKRIERGASSRPTKAAKFPAPHMPPHP